MSASEKEIILCIKPLNVVIPHSKIEDYGNKERLTESLIIHCDKPCYVLPSLRRAQVKSITKHVNDSTFKNYSGLKKYWKNMYGYRLPDVPEENICYFNIIFNTNTWIRDVSYTYPFYCVRSSPLIFKRAGINCQTVLCSFISDFCKRLGNVCGEKCKITDMKACFPSLQFYPALQVKEDMKPRPGTTYNLNTSTSSCVYRSKTNFIENYNANIDPCSQDNQDRLKDKILQNTSHCFSPVYSRKDASKIFLVQECHQFTSASCSSMTLTTENEKSQPKYAPHFYPKKRALELKANLTKMILENNSTKTLQKRLVPKFSSKKSNITEYISSHLTSSHEREKNSVKNQACKVISRKKGDISLKSKKPKEEIHFPDNGTRILKDFERESNGIIKSNEGKGKKNTKKGGNKNYQNEECLEIKRSKIRSRETTATKQKINITKVVKQ